MRISYRLEDTSVSATARIAAAQADALIARGHDVRIVTTALPLTWRSSRAEWIYVDEMRQYVPRDEEIVVSAEIIRAFPIVDEDLYRDRIPRENTPLRVLLAGSSQSEDKGISEGYGAVAHARWFHQTLDLVRVSPWAPSRDEPLDTVQEFHVALTSKEMTRLIHSCDVLVAPNRRDDPLSLSTYEALASSLACVVTATPPHQALTDAVVVGPPDNAVELGEKLIEVLSDPVKRDRLRARGREVAKQWRAENVVVELEKAIQATLPP